MAARTAPLVLLSVKVQPQTVRVVRPSRPRPGRRRLLAAALAVFAALVGVAAIATPAQADPEGGTAEMRRQLDEAQRGYLDAKAALDASVARQQELATTLESIEVQLAEEEKIVGEIGRHAFMSAGLLDTRANAQAAQEEIEVEVAMQSELFAEMENRKQQAQQALWAVGGGAPVAGFSAAASVVAEPAPRNASGGWSSEARSVYEPVTGGSITPRTAHAVAQAQAAGFTRYVACYRSLEDGGEHPRGRACDFAVDASGRYGGDAVGEAQDYGNNLAAFFIFNADRLGVLYVIWYQKIWLPGSGWRSYSGCCDPSSKHTNHVHLSMY
jgi:hypothetical protein